VNRRTFTAVMLAGIAGVTLALSGTPAPAQEFGSPELIAAAKAEGKLVFYTANFAEVPLKVTLVVPMRLFPRMFTTRPIGPKFGLASTNGPRPVARLNAVPQPLSKWHSGGPP